MHFIRSLIGASAMVLAGCSPSNEVLPVPPTVADPFVMSDTPIGAANADATTLDRAALSASFGARLNEARAQNRLRPLVHSRVLERIARGHAQDMERNGFFSHVSSNGNSLSDRTRAQGYRFCRIAENIARGQKTVNEVHTEWMNSAGHRANNLLPDASEFGIALVDDTWVLVIGADGC